MRGMAAGGAAEQGYEAPDRADFGGLANHLDASPIPVTVITNVARQSRSAAANQAYRGAG